MLAHIMLSEINLPGMTPWFLYWELSCSYLKYGKKSSFECKEDSNAMRIRTNCR